tara:strand:+ start:580 stop:4095 length:3516 start_codon:yes stop_codon:yes gene_type:complete
MAMPHKILRVFNKFKGLDTSSSDYERSPHHATTAQNLMLNDQGSLITRYGIQAHTTDATKQGFGILPYVNDAVPLIIQNTGIAATIDELITIGSEDIVRWYTDGSTNDILSSTSGAPIPRKDYIGTSSNTYATDKLLGYVDKVHVVNDLGENPSMDLLKNCVYITGVSSRGLLKYDGHMLQEASLLSTWDGADTDIDYSEPIIPTIDDGTTDAKRFKSDVSNVSNLPSFSIDTETLFMHHEHDLTLGSHTESTTTYDVPITFNDEPFALSTAYCDNISLALSGSIHVVGGRTSESDEFGDLDTYVPFLTQKGGSWQWFEVGSIAITSKKNKKGVLRIHKYSPALVLGQSFSYGSIASFAEDETGETRNTGCTIHHYLPAGSYHLIYKYLDVNATYTEIHYATNILPIPSNTTSLRIGDIFSYTSEAGSTTGFASITAYDENTSLATLNTSIEPHDDLEIDSKGASSYRYLYQKVHKDAKGNIHYGTPSSQHLDDSLGVFRQDIGLSYDSTTGVDFNELSIPFENSATSNARGSLIIGGMGNVMYTLECPSMPTYPIDTDAALTNNISCEIEVGDIVFAHNHGNTAGVGQCDEGVGGHTTKALCDEDIATGKQAHSDGEDGHFHYLSREYRVLSKTDGGLIKDSGITNGAGYTGSHDAANWKYWEIVVEPVVEGDPNWFFTSGANEFRDFSNFSGGVVNAADWEMWASASNHRILIYRTKNIWYPDIKSYIADPTYYLVEEIAQPANSYDNFDIGAFTTEKTVVFRDYQSDSSLAASEPFIVPDKIPGAAPKKCTLSTTYNNQLILSGDPDNPTTVYYSDYDAPENFPQGTNAFNVDEKVTGIKTVGQVLYIFQQDKIHMMSGDLIQDNFRVSQIASGPEIGTLAPNSLTEVEGSLFFTNKNGVFAVKGNQVVEVSKLIKKTFTKLKDDLDKRWNRISAYNWKERDIFVVYIPNKGVASGAGAFEAVNNGIEGADGSICLAYDYKRDAWFDWTVIRASGGFAFFNNKLYYTYLSEVNNSTGVANDGHLVSFEKTAVNKLGDCEGIADLVTLTGIPAKYGTHWESLGDPATPKKFLRIKIYSADSDGYGQEWSSTNINSIKQQRDYRPSTIATKYNLLINQSTKKWGMTKLNGTKCMSCRFLIEHTNTYNEPLVIKGIEIEVATPYKPGELKV